MGCTLRPTLWSLCFDDLIREKEPHCIEWRVAVGECGMVMEPNTLMRGIGMYGWVGTGTMTNQVKCRVQN